MLDNIPSKEELRLLNKEELDELAADIRKFLITTVSEKGGHLASNLGTVELTLALFRSFDFPKDRVIFDVGHQSYTYKLLSGRKEGFQHLRELDGMSGFPKCRESEFDAFDTGHSSTSISAGLGMVQARDLMHEDHHIVSVIGDGSMTGGMAFEALNAAAENKTNFIIILNDNELSISRNVGGMSNYLTSLRAGKGYNRVKMDVKQFLHRIPKVGDSISKAISDAKDSLKEVIVPNGMWFENMGITYLGPLDGHNVIQMEKVFEKAKELNKTVLIHVKTKKGYGYEPSEKHPEEFHGVGPFEIETGKTKNDGSKDYTAVFGEIMKEAGAEHKDLAAVTAAMSLNIGLEPFRYLYPERHFDVGIAEQHAVTFSAGLAKGGLHPVVAIYSSFLQRAYDQIIHDVCIQNLPVIFAIDRAGIVGKDGETHQGAFDISFLSGIPNMTLMAPKNAAELREMMKFAFHYRHPIAVRYPRGKAWEGYSDQQEVIVLGKGEVLHRGRKTALLCYGEMVSAGEEVRKILASEGKDITLVNMRFAKPVDEALLKELSEDHDLFVTMEDGILKGGISDIVIEFVKKNSLPVKVISVGIPDEFVPQGTPGELFKRLHMDADSTAERIRKEYV